MDDKVNEENPNVEIRKEDLKASTDVDVLPSDKIPEYRDQIPISPHDVITSKSAGLTISNVYHTGYHVKNYEDVNGYLVEATVTGSVSYVQIRSDMDTTYRTMERNGDRYWYIIDMSPAGNDWSHSFTIRAVSSNGQSTTYTDNFESAWEYKGRYSDSVNFETRTGTTDVTYFKGHYNVIKQSTGGDARHTISWSEDEGYFETWLCVDGRVSSPDTYVYLTESNNLNKYIYFRYDGTYDDEEFGTSQVSGKLSGTGFIDARPSQWNHVRIKFNKKFTITGFKQRITGYIDGTQIGGHIDIPWNNRVNVDTIRLCSTRAYWDSVSPEWTHPDYYLNDLKSHVEYQDLNFQVSGPTDDLWYDDGWKWDYIYDSQQSVTFDASANRPISIHVMNSWETGASFSYTSSNGRIRYYLPDDVTVSNDFLLRQNPTDIIAIRKGNAVLITKQLRVRDDDTTPPSINGLYIDNNDPSKAYWQLFVRPNYDPSGIYSMSATYNGVTYNLPWNSHYQMYGRYNLPVPSGAIHGDTYELRIRSTDNDNDRNNDRSTRTSITSVTFLDQTAPSIYSLFCNGDTEGEPIYTHYSAYDDSGIDYIQYYYESVNGSSSPIETIQFAGEESIMNSIELILTQGQYNIYLRGVDIYGNIGSWGTISIVIHDDDSEPPIVNWHNLNNDIRDGDLEKTIGFTATDLDSGLSNITINLICNGNITYSISLSLNGQQSYTWLYNLTEADLASYQIEVFVSDNDNDIHGDQESISVSSNVIDYYDDDTNGPTITYQYHGSGTDADPGYIEFYATDNSSISGPSTKTVSLNPMIIDEIQYITAGFWDNDDDRPNDRSYNSLTVPITLIDDDIVAPAVSNLTINKSPLDLTIAFSVLNEQTGDDSGLSRIKIFIDGIIAIDFTPSANQTDFSFNLDNKNYTWLTEFGIHDIEIILIDNDNDRPGDSLSTIVKQSFNTTSTDILEYIIWEIDELKEYIDEKVCFLIDWILKFQLECAKSKIEETLAYQTNDCETISLILEKLAKTNMDLLDFSTSVLNYFGLISENNANYIISNAQEIRDHISWSMGAIIGTTESLNIASLIVQIEQLNDDISATQDWCVAKRINCPLSLASNNLENMLIALSLNCDYWASLLLNASISNLFDAISTVQQLNQYGYLSDTEAIEMITIIESVINKL